MKIYINRRICGDCLSTCERHVTKLIQCPFSEDRPCITAIEDDGQLELVLVIQDRRHYVRLAPTNQDRESEALEGFSAFLPPSPSFYHP